MKSDVSVSGSSIRPSLSSEPTGWGIPIHGRCQDLAEPWEEGLRGPSCTRFAAILEKGEGHNHPGGFGVVWDPTLKS